jgi:glycerol kinase
MLFDIFRKQWDVYILGILDIPFAMLPQVRFSSEFYGYSHPSLFNGEIPITGMIGDQQASLFGQCCFEKGSCKNTYGTGCFMMMNLGKEPIFSEKGLVTTIAGD